MTLTEISFIHFSSTEKSIDIFLSLFSVMLHRLAYAKCEMEFVAAHFIRETNFMTPKRYFTCPQDKFH